MDFLVRRDDLHSTRFDDSATPVPTDGEALLSVSRFGLTANNITYTVFGDAMNYWDFFPAEDGWGRMPVWGFADVVASNAEGVAEGKRVYGYFPPSSHLIVRPDRADEAGFLDSSPHRAALPVVYNHYVFTDTDPNYDSDSEDAQMLLRPLFATSFLLDDQLADPMQMGSSRTGREAEDSAAVVPFFGASTVVLSSASSKTALAAAFLIARRDGPALVGLTSASRVGFVEGTGTYGRVVPYEEIGTLGDGPAVYLDFSGDADLRGTVHAHYGDELAHSFTIGATHWDKMAGGGELPGPTPTFFFAPDRAAKRTTDWGGDGLRERIAEAWKPFVEWSGSWLEVSRAEGAEAVENAYLEMLDGKVNPAAGNVLSLT
ncbi:MAG: DUF2855 family protein [Solirubrobacterales bacterium]